MVGKEPKRIRIHLINEVAECFLGALRSGGELYERIGEPVCERIHEVARMLRHVIGLVYVVLHRRMQAVGPVGVRGVKLLMECSVCGKLRIQQVCVRLYFAVVRTLINSLLFQVIGCAVPVGEKVSVDCLLLAKLLLFLLPKSDTGNLIVVSALLVSELLCATLFGISKIRGHVSSMFARRDLLFERCIVFC